MSNFVAPLLIGVTPVQDSSLDFHSGDILEGFSISPNEKFGVLTVKACTMPVTQLPVFMLFTIDKTDSMSERDSSGFTKIHYVKETFKKMVDFISKKNAPIYIRVHTFNTTVQVIVETVLVTPENAEEISQKITNIVTSDSTCIDCALQSANEAMLDYVNMNPTHSVHHVFMTDGEATSGLMIHSLLAEMVVESFPNTFIGFGEHHNADLLRKMSDRKMANYSLVDNNENTGLVYGDIIHGLLYPAAKDLTMHIEGGFLYDWKTNQWVTNLSEPILVSESTRTYHVKTEKPECVSIEIRGACANDPSNEVQLLETAFKLPDLESIETGEIMSSAMDLSRYVFRQATQELMFEARNADRSNQNLLSGVKGKMSDLFRKLRVYIREADIEGDPMLKQLCDDLYITHRTLGTRNGRMFTLARQATQGRQQSHIPSPRVLSENIVTPLQHPGDYDDDLRDGQFTPRVRRQNAMGGMSRTNTGVHVNSFPELETNFEAHGMMQDEDSIERHQMSDTVISCYATPSAVDTMRSMSQSMTQQL
jgi:hypothetical protein